MWRWLHRFELAWVLPRTAFKAGTLGHSVKPPQMSSFLSCSGLTVVPPVLAFRFPVVLVNAHWGMASVEVNFHCTTVVKNFS